MRYLAFGADEAQVSEVVLGSMRIAGIGESGTEELVLSAVDAGINFIDTADIYAGGESERLIGTTFERNPGLRDRVFLQTKCGIHITPEFTYFDFSKDYILSCVDASLERLKTDRLDALLLHRPDALMEVDEVAEAFDELHAAGKVLNFGVSNMNPSQMALLQSATAFPLVANQVQLSAAFAPAFEAGFNVNMENDPAVMRDGGIFEYAQAHDQVLQAWSVLQHGYFEGVFLGNDEYAELNAVLARIAEERGVTETAVALAWILRHPAKMQAVIGTTKPERVRESAAACDFELTRAEWYEIYLAAGRRLP